MDNATGNVTSSVSKYIGVDDLSIQVLFYISYAVIFFVGTGGNFLVSYVVIKNPFMHSVTNIFITNLAASDALMCLVCVPFTPFTVWSAEWYFGGFLCHFVPVVQATSVYVSTLTLTAIAIDRFVVICFPFKPRMKISLCLIIIFVIWIISTSLSLPMGVFMSNENEMCQEAWPTDKHRSSYTLTNMIMQLAIPLCIITFCYAMVSMKLSERVRVRAGSRSNRERDAQDVRRKRRTNRMLIAMVLIFACCWLPINSLHIITDYVNTRILYQEWYLIVFSICHLISTSSTCYNPFLYAWLNENFRKEFKSVLPCFKHPAQYNRSNGGVVPTHCNGNSPETHQTLIHGRQNSLRTEVHDGEPNAINSSGKSQEETLRLELLPQDDELVKTENHCGVEETQLVEVAEDNVAL